MNRVPIGRIVGVFGIHGEVKCDPTNAGRALFRVGTTLGLESRGTERDVRVLRARDHGKRLVLSIEGVNDVAAARELMGATFSAEREAVRLEPGEYFDADLVGCALSDASGRALGTVSAVEHYPGSDMLIVNGEMIPLVSAFVRGVDVSNKRIIVELPPGLISQN